MKENEYKQSEAIKCLEEIDPVNKRMPKVKYLDDLRYRDDFQEGLIRCIMSWLILSGSFAERIKGTSTVSAIIKGASVRVQILMDGDELTPDQLKYKRQVEDSRGYCVVARDFAGFLDWYLKFDKLWSNQN